jgi:hypothetical protein
MNTINAPYKGYAGFTLNGKIVIVGAVEDKQQFDCIDGVQMFFGKTLAELNTTIEDSIA